MSHKRKNKAPRGHVNRRDETEWFGANKKRQRKRAKLAKQSRKKNRN